MVEAPQIKRITSLYLLNFRTQIKEYRTESSREDYIYNTITLTYYERPPNKCFIKYPLTTYCYIVINIKFTPEMA